MQEVFEKTKVTAAPFTQCRSKKVSAENLSKMGISRDVAGDFRQFLAGVAVFGVSRHLSERKKAPIMRAFLIGGANYLKLREWAGWGGRIRTIIYTRGQA